ncbi:MAG: ribonuclease D [Halieaceae bacterium]
MSWELIETDAGLAEVLSEAQHADSVVIDTEFMRRNTFFPEVALLQISFGGTAWLIDPLGITNLNPLIKILTDPAVVKVLHSGSEDLEVFQRWLGVLPQPLFDTQRAAALLDMGFGLGYGALVEAVCQVTLEKGETRSDWLQRPLTDSQCHYAAQDVIYLHDVWLALSQKCREQDKYDWVLADGEDAIAGLASNGRDYFRRIKSAWKLDRRQLGALIAICSWREEVARERNKPRGWIIDDKVCLQLAQNLPASQAELKAAVEMPAPALRRYGEHLVALLEENRELPAESLPQRLPAPLSSAQRDRAKKLKQRVREIAVTLGTAPEILLGSKDYEVLLREVAGEQPELPRQWLGWRKEAVLTPLRDHLEKAAS